MSKQSGEARTYIEELNLDWLVENKLRQVEEVGKIMNYYYMDNDTVIDAAIKNKPPQTLLDE